jgi:DNA-binding response OmpR family regulator
MKVVLVDDNPDLSEMLAAIGKVQGIETVSFTSSLDALKFLDENEADVAILDLELPVMDGLRLAKEIRKNEEVHQHKSPLKMVFYTGQDIDETIERVGEKVGVEKQYMIRKPYELSVLVARLKEDFDRG